MDKLFGVCNVLYVAFYKVLFTCIFFFFTKYSPTFAPWRHFSVLQQTNTLFSLTHFVVSLKPFEILKLQVPNSAAQVLIWCRLSYVSKPLSYFPASQDETACVISKLLVLFQNCLCYFKTTCVISKLLVLLRNFLCYFKTACVIAKLLVLFQNCLCYFKTACVISKLLVLFQKCLCYCETGSSSKLEHQFVRHWYSSQLFEMSNSVVAGASKRPCTIAV
jgi:hypothetical protein